MARLIYGTFEVRPSEMRTLSYTVDPVMDSSGTDILYHRVTIACTAVINPYRFSTNQTTIAGAGGQGTMATAPGDRAGLTIKQIQEKMSQPRQTLQYFVGQDLVLESPMRTGILGATGQMTYLTCDANGGPFVQECRILDLVGDKTALLSFRVTTVTGPCGKFLLSNRWSQSCEIDERGFTTRTTSGEAKFHLGAMINDSKVADDFRKWLIVPGGVVPGGGELMRRVGVHVQVNERGDTMRYTVTDREVMLGVAAGGDQRIIKIEGTATVGVHIPISGLKGVFSRIIDVSRAAIPGGVTPIDFARAGLNVASMSFNNSTYNPTANIVVRVYGRKWTEKITLYSTGVKVIYDRFAPLVLLGKLGLISLYVTQWLDSDTGPVVEVRAELIPSSINSVLSMLDPGRVKKIMNWDNNMTQGGLSWTDTSDPPVLPRSNNTRGAWAGRIAAQVLSTVQCDLPAAPPAPAVHFDIVAAK